MHKNEKVTIVVIDSGIDSNLADLGNYVVRSTGFELDDQGYIIENQNKEIKNPHGTVISLIIRHICSNIELISFNILNERLAADGRMLIFALEQALSLQPDIIHLSLGTTKQRYKFALKKLIRIAQQKNIVIVAAAHNDETMRAYPACLKEVIGVKSGGVENNLKYFYKNDFFYAPASAEHIPGVAETGAQHANGTSIAAAYITGHIAGIMLEKNLRDVTEVTKLMISNQN